MSLSFYKRNPEGLRRLVELLETTPMERRTKMIEAGNREDKHYTDLALSLMMSFTDIISMPDMELAEVAAHAPVRTIAAALFQLPEEVRKRFFLCSPAKLRGDLKEYMEHEFTLREVGGARLKMVEIARGCERRGLIKTKHISV
jgi:flagellar motor switch protein FliG